MPATDIDDLVTALLTASRALVGVSARSLDDVMGDVTLTQFRTLVVLRAHGATGLSTLAGRLDVNASTALRTVDRLVTEGLLDRQAHPDDRRAVVISLTEEGRKLVDRVTGRRRRAIAKIVGTMPARDRDALVHALVEFARAADEPLAADAVALGW